MSFSILLLNMELVIWLYWMVSETPPLMMVSQLSSPAPRSGVVSMYHYATFLNVGVGIQTQAIILVR